MIALTFHVNEHLVQVDFALLDQDLMQIERTLLIQQIVQVQVLDLPATCFIALICAAEPTRDTEIPTLIAGRIPALNKSPERKI